MCCINGSKLSILLTILSKILIKFQCVGLSPSRTLIWIRQTKILDKKLGNVTSRHLISNTLGLRVVDDSGLGITHEVSPEWRRLKSQWSVIYP